MIASRSRSGATAHRFLAHRFLALASLALAAPALAFQGPPPAAVRVDAVRSESLVNRRPVTGDLRAAHRGLVATREKGLVMELKIDEGQVVERGAVLARLDSAQLELDLLVLKAQRPPSEAGVKERRANVARAQSDLESIAALVERSAANPKELVDAQADLEAAEARLTASEAQLTVIDAQVRKLEQRIADTTIVAPFSGTVVQKLTEVGSWVAEGSAVVELLSTNELEVWLEVPQDLFAPVLQSKSPIEIHLGAGDEGFAMSDYLVIPDVDVRGRAFRLVGKAPSELPLAAGMSVVGMVPTGVERELLTVHRDAILRNQISSYVYSVLPGAEGGPSKAAPIDVEVLFQTEARAVVRSPRLRPGMEVVVEGNERLYPMAAITPIRGAPAPTDGRDSRGDQPAEGSSR